MSNKLDFTAAWNDALALLNGHKDVVLPIAGVFILLPTILMGYFVPEPDIGPATGQLKVIAVLIEYYQENALWFIGTTILAIIANLAIYLLILSDTKPTVGQALALSTGFFLTFYIANLISALAIFIGMFLLIIPGFYLAIKLSLTGPAIVAEEIKNPIAALSRSWRLTKGNSLYIFAFYAIILIVSVVIYMVVTGILGEISGMILPESGASLLELMLSSISQVAINVIFLFITAAVYRQLSAVK